MNVDVTSVSDIYGRYNLQTPGAAVELQLSPDMKFTETITFPSARVVVLKGEWAFHLIQDAGEVALDGAANISNDLSPEKVGHVWTEMEAGRWFGKTRLCANAGQDLYFVQVPPR